MKFILLLFITRFIMAETIVINQGDLNSFFEFTSENRYTRFSENYLKNLSDQNISNFELSESLKTWDNHKNVDLIVSKFNELNRKYIFSSENRAWLFEYFFSKHISGIGPEVSKNQYKNLMCQLYINDQEILLDRPFFIDFCNPKIIPVLKINPIISDFNEIVIDGNRKPISQNSFIRSIGRAHNIVLLSDSKVPIHLFDSIENLNSQSIKSQNLVDGPCKNHKPYTSLPNHLVYFNRNCVKPASENTSSSGTSWFKRNGTNVFYFLLAGLAVYSIKDNYEFEY